ncbi:MAG: FecR family protein, partial [Elusimicrobia bacterium]|nr:FecR family protein [Elusimicrobiota bacterium]
LYSLENLTQNTSMNLLRGRFRSRVKKLSSAESFEVHTPVAVCAVRGTDFEVEAGPKTLLKTYEGSVALKNIETGDEVLVKSGQQSVVEAGKAPTRPENFPEKVIPEPEEEPEEEAADSREIKSDQRKDSKEPQKEKPRKSASGGKSPLTVEGTLGADVLRDPDNPSLQKVYYNLSLMPELSLWKFGVGLDIKLYFDEDGNIRKEEWDEWPDMLQKVWYVRYGQRTDPLYIYAGGIKTYTMGSGIIVSRYSNMLNYPEVRKIGINTKIDMGEGGVEAFVSDVNEYPLFGGRVFYRPLLFTGIPILKSVELGVQGAADYNPDKKDATEKDDVIFYGADTVIPLINMTAASADIYGGYATYKTGDRYNIDEPGDGMSVGLKGNIIKFIKYGMNYSKVDNNFEIGYFDRYYEVRRATNPYLLKGKRTPVKEGPKFLIGFNFLDKADFSIEYENYNIDSGGRYPYFHGELNIAPSLLLDKYSLSVYYDKTGVETFKDLTDLSGAIMTTEIGYNIAPNVTMVIVRRQTFTADGESEKTISMRTRFSF